MRRRNIPFTRDWEREWQYGAHSVFLSPSGRRIYSKKDDHIVDADRCAMAAIHHDEILWPCREQTKAFRVVARDQWPVASH